MPEETTPAKTTEQDDGGPTPGFGGLLAIAAVALSVAALARRTDA